MRLLFAVVEELYTFALEALFGSRRKVIPGGGSVVLQDTPIPLKERSELPKIETHTDKSLPVPGIAEIMEELSMTRRAPQKNTIMYTASIGVPLRREPRTNSDNVYATLPYGAMVMVLDTSDGWSRVITGDQEGWVLADDLADRAAHVYPQFVIGEENDAEEPNTIRLRAIINDEFGYGDVDMPLQAEEYVLYKLYRRNAKISWPDMRSRTPGSWKELLEKAEGVIISDMPRAGAVIEFSAKEHKAAAHLAYVEAVFPDESIQLSEANWPDRGIYNERVLTDDEWQKLNPTFLLIS